jgi:hypothetical protein
MTRTIQQRQATRRTQPPIAPPPDVPSQVPARHSARSPTITPPPSNVPSQAPTPCSTTSGRQSPTIFNSDVPSQAPKRRRGAKSKIPVDEEDKKYYQLGKMVPRLVHPFLPVQQLIHTGSLLYMLQHMEDDEDLELGSEIEML